MTTLTQLPDDLPIPVDDGGCDHLVGMKLPNVTLASTQGDEVNLSTLSGTTVIYLYPMTGRPDTPLPDGWEQIPGARGCTPQSCSFRDHHAELGALGAVAHRRHRAGGHRPPVHDRRVQINLSRRVEERPAAGVEVPIGDDGAVLFDRRV